MPPSERHPDDRPAAPAVSDAVRAGLDAWPHAAFVIDPQTATLLAANGPGRDMYPGLPVTFDGAMPAMRALRAIARTGGVSKGAVPLVFWTANGIEALACEIATVADAAPLLAVRAVAARRTRVTLPEAKPREPMSDAEALHDIARRIRDGQARVKAPDPAPANEDLEPAKPVSELPADVAVRGIDLAKLAHELKTPLSAITAASEIMKEGRFGEIGNDRYAGYIADIHASARHALELIQRMLDRPAAADPPRARDYTFEKIELDAFVDACLSTVRPLAAAKGLSLVARRSKAPAKAVADATALKQIVLNLVTNAIKFTPAGGRITVSTAASRRGAELTVEDTGCGMTAVAIAEALRPVPRDVPSIREGGGLGLGLPMSRALAEEMGATLSIDSAPGRGTRVKIAFPGGAMVVI